MPDKLTNRRFDPSVVEVSVTIATPGRRINSRGDASCLLDTRSRKNDRFIATYAGTTIEI